MKKPTYYPEDFKRIVVQSVLSGIESQGSARRKYGIKGKSAILYWIRKFGGSKTQLMNQKRSSKNKPTNELEVENKRLKAELEIERLKVLSLNVMIDLAEEQFKVPIRKKSGAKQSKK